VIDPTFKAYSPAWPASFDVIDVTADSTALTMIENLPDVPTSMRKMALLSALRILSEMGGYDQALIESARKEIDELPADHGSNDGVPTVDTGAI
jgi:hypothetical protein